MDTTSYTLSGTFVQDAITNILESGATYHLLDYNSAPKYSQQWVGSVCVVSSSINGVEEGLEAAFKYDENDAGQLDVYARPYTSYNGKTWRGKNQLSGEAHHPTTQISGTVTIHDCNIPGVTQNTISFIRLIPKQIFSMNAHPLNKKRFTCDYQDI